MKIKNEFINFTDMAYNVSQSALELYLNSENPNKFFDKCVDEAILTFDSCMESFVEWTEEDKRSIKNSVMQNYLRANI